LYPARLTGGSEERSAGHVPVDTAEAPFPVVIFFSGINCCSDSYKWLAVELVKRGLVVILFDWVGETFPGVIGLTNGVDLSQLKPETYGSGPTTLALPAILFELEALQREGALAGLLDLRQIILGGHSAGGSMALQNANRKFFPNVKGAFAYGAHNLMSAALGWPPNALAPLSSEAPLLLLGGARDGVIAASANRYGVTEHQNAYAPIERTFDEAIAGGRGQAYLAILEGANHTSLVHPPDQTTSRAFLDQPTTAPDEAIRALLVELIGNFIDGVIRHKPEAQRSLEALLRNNPMLAVTKCK
jgi:pimeloyl-ACP methyl ester carboxylesterase